MTNRKSFPRTAPTLLSDTQHTSTDLMVRALDAIGDCTMEWHMSRDIMVWSGRAADILGVQGDELPDSNRSFQALLRADCEQKRADVVLSSTDRDSGAGVPYEITYSLDGSALADGVDVAVEEHGRWFAGPDGAPERVFAVLRRSTQAASDEEASRSARQDPLTGLVNRVALDALLEDEFARLARDGGEGGLLLVGIDHFDLINSAYGHAIGDEVIRTLADRLATNLRGQDIVARFSGAKIAVILPESNEHEMLVAGYRVLDMLSGDLVDTSAGQVAVSVSVGGVALARYAKDARSAFMAAQQALTDSRRRRDASLVAFRPDPARDLALQASAKMAERIVSALREGRIHLAWQPVVDATTQQIAFREGLLRLREEDGHELKAGDFVDVAQRLGLIRLVDHHALDAAIKALAERRDGVISLNVSNETACDPLWLSKLASAVRAHPHIADCLIVEITESHAAESVEEALRFINAVKGLGCRVALDDFGAGFTSFRNLKSLPFDIIKVDGQFVDDIANNPVNQSFIRSLVELAGLFEAKIVVEWIEDEATAAMLRDWGVDYLQGFHFGHAISDDDWAETPVQAAA